MQKRTRSTRSVLSGFLVLAVAACSATGDEVDSTDAPATTEAAVTTEAPATTEANDTESTVAAHETTAAPETTTTLPQEPGRGVSDDAIKIGVIYPDLESVRDFVDIDHGDYASAFQILADDINANGGINGRMIDIVQGPVGVLGNEAAATMCTQMTEDEQVFAVIGAAQAEAVSCYVTDHDTVLIGGEQTVELVTQAVAPWFTFEPSLDHLAQKTIEGVAAEGGFDGTTVGLISLPVYENLVANTLDPALDAAGVDVVNRALIDTPSDDPAAAEALAATILERFRADGIDTIVIVADAMVSVGNAMLQTDYRPRLISTSQNSAATWVFGKEDTSPANGLVAGSPVGADIAWTAPKTEACVAKIAAADPNRDIVNPATRVEGELETFVSVLTACKAMDLFQAIATAAGPGLNNETFRAAGDALGAFDVAGTGGGQVYSSAAPSGDEPIYLARYDEATKKLVTDPTPVP